MSENTQNTPRPSSSLLELTDRTKRRNASEKRFRAYGIGAIAIGLLMLAVLVFNIVSKGTGAFQQTFITLDVELLESKLDKKGNRDLADIKKVTTFGYSPIIRNAIEAKVTGLGIDTPLKAKDMAGLLSKDAAAQLREFVVANPEKIGDTIEFRFLAQSRVDGYLKGRVIRANIANDKNISSEQLDLVDALVEAGVIAKTFNWDFILGADASDARPEAAGIGVSMMGSLFMMLVVLALALPIGVAASIYLEEFAPQNWLTDIIEVNISNLAAVPSIVFGILGLAVFHQLHALADLCAAGGWSGADADDAADHHYLYPCLAEVGSAVDPRCGTGGRGLENAGGVPPRAAAGRTGHPDRHHYWSGTGAGGNRAASADRHGGLYRLQPAARHRRRPSVPELCHACPDL